MNFFIIIKDVFNNAVQIIFCLKILNLFFYDFDKIISKNNKKLL